MDPLGRPLRMKADWGMANFYRIFGWLAHGLYTRFGPPGLSQVETGQAWVDNIESLVSGASDVTIATPTEFGVQAMLGIGQFETPHPELRALGVLPHDDAVLFAVPAELPFTSIEEIAESQYPLRIAAPPNDGVCAAGWACQMILDESGLTVDALRSAGGEFLYREYPRLCPPLVLAGHADAVINEAMMLPDWRDLAARRPMRFLSVGDDVLARLTEKYHLRSRWVHSGRLPGQDEPIHTVDFSGWLVIVTEAMPDELAYNLTAVMVETRGDLERLFAGPLETSPLAYPIRPDHMPLTGEVPLHPGAARYYRERGLFERWV
jgi:TRAP-type uncharacterized transport system substrate-binding protein